MTKVPSSAQPKRDKERDESLTVLSSFSILFPDFCTFRQKSLSLRAATGFAIFDFCLYKIGYADASYEYERLKQEQEAYVQEKHRKKVSGKEKISLPTIPKLHLPGRIATQKVTESAEQTEERCDN